ncbi:MAG: HEAT repeat domain-containing protein, partial [Chloroflexi bacterium]|nr:HEAT repeat domain-containing protein [Chloroflexota bacterium]
MREPSLSQGRSAEPEPSGAEPGLRAEYALLDVLLTLGHLDPAEREAAIELLTELGREAIPALVRASTEARRDSRLAAAHAMGILGYDEFLPELHRLAHDPDSWTHTVAAQAYTRIALTQDDPRAVLQLFAGGLPPAAAAAVDELLVAHGYPLERELSSPP